MLVLGFAKVAFSTVVAFYPLNHRVTLNTSRREQVGVSVSVFTDSDGGHAFRVDSL